ncbi:hypothetical protein WR25_22866 [Diploscapter pachys]|uniref:Uncharacterized protein n=1 Tax=Diploscapter pachys TaxID=2018661 RepID=A0A2A2K702_9BILA|nr:hypothetical protein WR25_22866 [Diploscapter pachys]
MAVSEPKHIQESADEIHIISHLSFTLDEDLKRPGVNLLIKASRLLIPDTVAIDTSGKDADHQYSSDAGQDGSGNGRDGSDGYAGESAGNVLIEADYIDHPENLEIISNGGRGSNGQDGGNGIDGQIGKGMTKNDLDKLFSPTAAYLDGFRDDRVKKVIDNIDRDLDTIIKAWWTGKDANTWLGVWENIKAKVITNLFGLDVSTSYQNNCIYVEAKLKSGMTMIFAWECGGVLKNCQSYLLVKGTNGSPGGDGGAAGKGGQGGFAGSITVDGEVTRGEAGENGSNGDRGKNGKNGKNGWDIGWLDYSVSGAFGADDWPKYRGTGEDTKLELRPYENNNSNRIACPYRRQQNYSNLYMEMVGARLEHPKQREATRSQQRQRDMQHQANATRKSNIDVSAMTQHQSNIFTAAEQMIATLRQSHQAACRMVQKSIELEQHQSQVKADMTVNRQVEYTQKRRKPKARAPLESKKTKPSWRNKRQVFLKKLFELVGKIDWNEEMVQKLCPKEECNIKCDDNFLRKVSQANWSSEFEQFLNFFTDEKENLEEKDFEELQTKKKQETRRVIRLRKENQTNWSDRFKQLFNFSTDGKQHFEEKDLEKLQKEKKQGARRVIRQFVLEIGENGEDKKIKALYEEYLDCLKKKDQNLTASEESLTKIDEKCLEGSSLLRRMLDLFD